MLILNSLNARKHRNSGEVSQGLSKTVPGQVEPLSSMLLRYRNGVPLTGNSNEPMYYDGETPPLPESLDLTEVDEYRQQYYAMKLAYDDQVRTEREKYLQRVKDLEASAGKASVPPQSPSPQGEGAPGTPGA